MIQKEIADLIFQEAKKYEAKKTPNYRGCFSIFIFVKKEIVFCGIVRPYLFDTFIRLTIVF